MIRNLITLAILALLPMLASAAGETCFSNSECERAEYCKHAQSFGVSTAIGTCVSDPNGTNYPTTITGERVCSMDDDCKSGESCNSSGRCRESSSGRHCSSDLECGVGMDCNNSRCERHSSGDASGDEVPGATVPGTSTRPQPPITPAPAKKCKSDDQCPVNFKCQSRRCVFNPFANSN